MKKFNCRRGVHISPQDERLFLYLYENKVATCDQIFRDIYPLHEMRSVHRRLRKLATRDLVKPVHFGGLQRRLAYSLGDIGFREFIKPLGEKIKQETGSQAVFHDLTLVDIRHHLESSPCVKRYDTENWIKAGGAVDFDRDIFFISGVRPDAILGVQLERRTFCLPLEYESSRKFQSRYQNLFRRYYSNPAIEGVLYVCGDGQLLKTIQGYERQTMAGYEPKFYYSDFSTWQSGERKLFTALDGARLIF